MAYGTIKVDTIENTNGQTGNAIGPGFKNRIINGAMMIDQRNAGASVTISDAVLTYTLDRWYIHENTGAVVAIQQSTTAPTGFKNSLLWTVSSSGSVSASSYGIIVQSIEGFNVADLGFGSAGALTITISFWVRCSVTGTYGGAIRNSAQNRSYSFPFTINSANTWEQKTVTIAGDTSGTWLTNNGAGLDLIIALGSGSNFQSTANVWYAGNQHCPTGSASLVGTAGATFYITGVQLEVGPSATSFDYRPYGTELMLCQRYFQNINFQSGDTGMIGQVTSTTGVRGAGYFFSPMRASPTVTLPAAGKSTGQIAFLTAAAGYPTTVGSHSVGANSTMLNVATAGGYSADFVAGNASILFSQGNSTGSISAEL